MPPYVKKDWVGSTSPLVGAPGATPITDVALDHLETQYDEAVAYTDTAISGLNLSGAVASVAGKTGAVTLVRGDVGLGSVDNTADAAKPVSTAQATAIAAKANTSHTHAESDVTGLVSDLAGKAATVHTHVIADTTGLQTALDGKQAAGSYAAATHSHAESDVTGLVSDLAAKAPLASPAFTGTPTGISKAHVGLGNVDNTADTAKPVSTAQQTALDGKAALTHTHAQSDVTGLTAALAGKAAASHTHNISDINATGTPSSTTYLRGDGTWVAPSGGGAVSSVAGRTGAVTLTADDVSDGTTNKAYSATERTKLSGIATAATANSADATLLARANHTGTQSADTITDGTTNKAYTATEKTKLAGVETAATANSADATLLARANHTGTQTASTISDFSTAVASLFPGVPVYVQSTDPALAPPAKYVWFDTTGGNINMWINDGT